jgi:hypothetical protein
MSMTRKSVWIAAGVLLAAAPALAGSTHLLAAQGARKEADLRGYERVQVVPFADATKPKFDKPADETEFRASVAIACQRFAQMIVDQLEATKSFETATTAPIEGKGLVVGGEILVYKESNLAARYIGLGIGGSEFDAKVDVKDAESGKVLGTMTIEFGSSPIPGATNVVQTAGLLMNSAAQQFRDEMLIAKHVKHREETGRSGRARERYKSGN